MRAVLVLVGLGALWALTATFTEIDLTPVGANPVLMGYGALFAAGIVAAELLRPVLALLSPASRFVVVAVLAALVWVGFQTARTAGMIPDSVLTADRAGQARAVQTRIPPAWDGVYRAVFQINRQSTGAMVDLGTPLVLLQAEEAERMGFDLSKVQYNQRVPLADRRIRVAPLTFLSVGIDDIELFGVKGAIAAPGELDGNVIGLSFLQGLSAFGLVDGVLYLRQ